jgi:hypothetical protein
VTIPLIVKCLKCKNSYEEEAVVTVTAIHDPDTGTFIQLDVTFADVSGNPVYLQDLLCLPNRCSVFGRLPDGTGFAYPFLVLGKNNVWHSRPDNAGHHYAERRVKHDVGSK